MQGSYCNKCGKELAQFDLEAYYIRRRMGYGSKYDLDLLDLNLCSRCLDELIDSCEISPITEQEETQ